MRVNYRERSILIQELCIRLGKWGEGGVNQGYGDSILKTIREDAERLVELLDAQELSLYRKYPSIRSDEG